MTKTIRLGNRLRYPITIVRLLKSPGDKIKKQEALLEYSFKWMKEVGDTIRGETWQEEQTTIVTWESPTDGELKQWHVHEGQHIPADRACMAVEETCSHEIQFQGLCGICGKDMTEVNWAAETQDTARAPISMVHDQTNLTVSAVQAQRTEQELQRRLLQSRKLSLVVDLDQTIIQACIDPTVGEWQKDPTNPNYESVKEVKSFQLDDGPSESARRCSYYIKMRPGLEGFLRRVSEMYELHVYTMGTRAYAQSVARVVDPDRKLFGNRVISRDENGNIFTKSLQRLFPVSTHMVVIIDDRSDVWPRNRPNLIKVSPYEFFKGIGDINSSFLPKRQDLLKSDATVNGAGKRERKKDAAPRGGDKEDRDEKEEKDVADPALEAIVNMAAGDESALTKRQVEEQERAFEKQIKDRPLQVLQEQLDREDEEAERATVQSEDGSESRSSSPPPHRHRVLQDDDDELKYLEQHLARLHGAYYAEYDRNLASHHAMGHIDLSSVPDVGQILDELKSRVLRGFKIVLSGVLPRGIDIYRSEIGMQIMSFGAELRPKVRGDVTHLVVNAAQPGREKLLEARRRSHIKIVTQEWLADCFSQWEAVDETPYLFTARLVDEGDDGGGNKANNEEGEVLSEEEPDGQAGSKKLTNGVPKLKLINTSGRPRGLPRVQVDGDDADGDGDIDGDEKPTTKEGGDDGIEDGLVPPDLSDGQRSPIDGLQQFDWGSADKELEEFLASGSDDDDDDDVDDAEEDDVDDDDDLKDADFALPDQGEEESSSSSGEELRRRRANRSRSGSRTRSKTASPASASRKRKNRDEGSVDGDGAAAAGEPGDEEHQEGAFESPAKRLRRTQSQRTSSLRNQYVAGEQPREGKSEGRGDGEGSSLPTPLGTDDQDKEAEEGAADAVRVDDEEMEFDEAALEAEFEAEFERDLMMEGVVANAGALDAEKG